MGDHDDCANYSTSVQEPHGKLVFVPEAWCGASYSDVGKRKDGIQTQRRHQNNCTVIREILIHMIRCLQSGVGLRLLLLLCEELTDN